MRARTRFKKENLATTTLNHDDQRPLFKPTHPYPKDTTPTYDIKPRIGYKNHGFDPDIGVQHPARGGEIGETLAVKRRKEEKERGGEGE